MFPIYLLEDDPIQQKFYRQVIKNTIMINEYAMQLQLATDTVSDFEQPLAHVKQGLFFLDMEIGTDVKAGLKLATQIRRQVPFAQIVFITTHDELSFLTLQERITPLDYILKDQDPAEIQQHLIDDLKLANQKFEQELFHHASLFRYNISDKYFSLPMSDLIMLSTNKKQPGVISLTGINRKATFPGNLNTIETEYDNLFRCDKSYLVNLDQMQSYDAHEHLITFNDNSQCKVSFRKGIELKKMLKRSKKRT